MVNIRPKFCPNCGAKILKCRRPYMFNIYNGECTGVTVHNYCPNFASNNSCYTYIWYERATLSDKIIFSKEI